MYRAKLVPNLTSGNLIKFNRIKIICTGGIHMYKINDKFPKNALTFLRELLVLYRDSRVMNGVGERVGTMCD